MGHIGLQKISANPEFNLSDITPYHVCSVNSTFNQLSKAILFKISKNNPE
ncbi:MAG: hypothetical protein WCG25_02825 [bacterium]